MCAPRQAAGVPHARVAQVEVVEHPHGHLGARVAAALGDELLPRHVEPQLAWLGLGVGVRVRVSPNPNPNPVHQWLSARLVMPAARWSSRAGRATSSPKAACRRYGVRVDPVPGVL